MRFCIAFLCILVALLAIIVGRIYQKLLSVSVPDDFPENSTWQFKLVAFSHGLAKDVSYLATLLGIGDDYYANMASLLSFTSRLYKNSSYSNFLEVNDTELFGVGVRMYKPVNKINKQMGGKSDKQDLLPGLIYFHGGGWTWGSLEGYDDFCSRLAVSAQIIVVSASYRQAPQYTYPTQFHDCYNVALGVLNTGAKHGIDVSRVMIAGESSGGNLAAAVSHYLATVSEMHCKTQYLKAQILIYPSLQFLDFNLSSYVTNAANDILSREEHANFVSLYLNGSTDLTEVLLSGNHSLHLRGTKYMSYLGKSSQEILQVEPQIELDSRVSEALTHFQGSPLMAEDFRGIPSTFIITAHFDVLRDEGLLYSERLRNGRVPVKYKNYKSFHGFVTTATEGGAARTDEGDEAFADIVHYIKGILTNLDKLREEE